MDTDYLTVIEVAQILRKGVQMVRLDIKSGKIPAHREGRKWLIKSEDIINLVKGS